MYFKDCNYSDCNKQSPIESYQYKGENWRSDINDPFGQIHSYSNSDQYIQLLFC